MERPLFSVVIPTRDRPETLVHCLRTCIQQKFVFFEFVVSDYYAGPGTRTVVDSLQDPRIRYLRTPRALAMSDNWEFAVGHAAGEYVLVLGDDDGLLFDCLHLLTAAVAQTRAAAITWPQVFYTWPNYPFPHDADYLKIPVADDRCAATSLRRPRFRNALLCRCIAPTNGWIRTGVDCVTRRLGAIGRLGSVSSTTALGARFLDGRETIREVIRFDRGYWELPMIYNSAIRRSLLDDLKSRAGRLFPSRVPDIFSGFAFAFLADRIAAVSIPLSISGVSGKSTGVAAQLMPRGQSPVEVDFYRLNETAQFVSHPWAPNVPAPPYRFVAESFLAAKQLLFAGDDSLRLNRRTFVEKVITGLRAETREEFMVHLRTIRESLSDSESLQSWFDARTANIVFQPPALHVMKPTATHLSSSACHLDAKRLGIRNVYDVAEFYCREVRGLPYSAIRSRAS